MSHTSEYEVENMFIDRLESIGYKFVKLDDYDDVLSNFREQLAVFNAKKLEEKGHAISFSDAEFNRIMIHIDNHSVYESAKILRDKFVLICVMGSLYSLAIRSMNFLISKFSSSTYSNMPIFSFLESQLSINFK